MGEVSPLPPGRTTGFAGHRCAVVDLETTGIFPARHDRILEVAVVVMRADGRIEDEFVTLVNPNRDVGPTHLHGITASDVASAPTFQEVAGDVLGRMCGAVVAGHNVRFDEGFVRAECARFDLTIPEFPMLCTLGLVSTLGLDVASRKLADCCEAVGVDARDAHSALGDARATAGLLTALLRAASDEGVTSLSDLGCSCSPSGDGWPEVTRSGKALPRSHARRAAASEVPFLARLVAALPHDSTLSGNAAGYLDTLDRALADRFVTAEEADALLALARTYGLSRGDVEALHRRYYAMLHRAALADGRITESERRDLDTVARLLGMQVSTLEADSAEPSAVSAPQTQEPSQDSMPGLSHADLAGKSVCFTGELAATIAGEPVSRERAESLAREAGLVVAKGVTKSLDFLVLADPMSMSGKAKKARQYGTRLLAEPVFWSALGVAVD